MTRSTPGVLTSNDIAVYLAAYGDDEAVRTSCAYYANTRASAEQIRNAAEAPPRSP